jgi:DNA-binding transcriptional LysR family regulator
MSMREIEIFRAVMTAGSTSKAAALMGISQPAVSQGIRKLEVTAGLRLFERVRGRLVPTQEALALMVDVNRYFVGFEVIEHRIRSIRSFGLGRLSIAVMPALGMGFMPRVIAAFGAHERGIQISLQVMSSREVHQQVSSGQVDFGLMSDEMSMTGLEHSVFSKMPGVAVMNADHPYAAKRSLKPDDLGATPFIALNPEDSNRRRMESLLDNLGISLKPLVETPYSHTVCELALSGVGIAVVNPIVAIDYLGRGIVIKPLEIDTTFTALMAFRPGTPLSENARQFLRFMRMQLSGDQARLNAAMGLPVDVPVARVAGKSTRARVGKG